VAWLGDREGDALGACEGDAQGTTLVNFATRSRTFLAFCNAAVAAGGSGTGVGWTP